MNPTSRWRQTGETPARHLPARPRTVAPVQYDSPTRARASTRSELPVAKQWGPVLVTWGPETAGHHVDETVAHRQAGARRLLQARTDDRQGQLRRRQTGDTHRDQHQSESPPQFDCVFALAVKCAPGGRTGRCGGGGGPVVCGRFRFWFYSRRRGWTGGCVTVVRCQLHW